MEENKFLEGKKIDNLDTTSVSEPTMDETSEIEDVKEEASVPELNNSPIPTEEEIKDGEIEAVEDQTDEAEEINGDVIDNEPLEEPEQNPTVAVESETLVETPVENENVDNNDVQEDMGVMSSTARTFTQDEVNELTGKTRMETREKTFRYIYDRYGVNSEEELDDLIGNAQRYDSLQEKYNGDKKVWKEQSDSRDKELAEVKEQVALMQSGIDSERYEDAKLILRGKGLEVNTENIQNELAKHPEWKKNDAGEPANPNFTKVSEPQEPKNAEPVSKISVLGNEKAPMDNAQSEEDYVLGRMFKV